MRTALKCFAATHYCTAKQSFPYLEQLAQVIIINQVVSLARTIQSSRINIWQHIFSINSHCTGPKPINIKPYIPTIISESILREVYNIAFGASFTVIHGPKPPHLPPVMYALSDSVITLVIRTQFTHANQKSIKTNVKNIHHSVKTKMLYAFHTTTFRHLPHTQNANLHAQQFPVHTHWDFNIPTSTSITRTKRCKVNSLYLSN